MEIRVQSFKQGVLNLLSLQFGQKNYLSTRRSKPNKTSVIPYKTNTNQKLQTTGKKPKKTNTLYPKAKQPKLPPAK